MPSETLSTAVKRFLRDHIQSVEQIEILALMQNAPGQEWTARALHQVLRSSDRSIARRLAEFARVGLFVETASEEPTYRYQPRESALAAAAVEAVQAYRERRVLVIETIFNPGDDSAQSFADAFRIRPR